MMDEILYIYFTKIPFICFICFEEWNCTVIGGPVGPVIMPPPVTELPEKVGTELPDEVGTELPDEVRFVSFCWPSDVDKPGII